MGNMIGSGVFLLPASLAPFGWNGVIGWVATIAGALVLAWLLAKLTRAHPAANGPMGFVGDAFGAVPAFLIGWVYLISIWTAVVTIAVAAVSYASAFFPGMGSDGAVAALWATGLIVILTAVNLRGAQVAGAVQVVTLLIKVVPLVVVMAIAAALLAGGNAELRPLASDVVSLPTINAAGALTLWALVGFECASFAGAQVENPEVNVPRATLWGTGLTGLLYLLVCSAIALMLPQAVAEASPAPFATFVERFWSPQAATLVALFAVVSCVGAVNGWILVQGELPRDMAARGMLPRWLARTDARGTPVRGILVSLVVVAVFAQMNASGSMRELFEYLLLLSTSASLWLYLACALAAFRLSVARGWAVIGAAYSLWALWGAGVGASGLSLVLMLSGLPLYWWTRASAGKRVEPAGG